MTEDQIEEFNMYLSRAQRYCSLREKCESEIMGKLKEWKTPEMYVSGIIAALKKEMFLDEDRFACAFARDKFRFSKWGKIKIEHALRIKKIASQSIRDALNGIDEADYFALIRKEIAGKRKSVKGKDEFEIRGKILRYLAGKGFEGEVCQKLLNEQ